MIFTLEFTIDGLPRMPNQLLGAAWRTRAGHAKRWERAVWLACWHLRPNAPLIKAQLVLTRLSSRTPDFDGLVGSFKAVIDGLVKCGVLSDDNFEVIGQPKYVHQRISPLKGRIHVKVEEVECALGAINKI